MHLNFVLVENRVLLNGCCHVVSVPATPGLWSSRSLLSLVATALFAVNSTKFDVRVLWLSVAASI